MKIDIKLSDHLWNYIAVALSLLSNFIMLPFILHYLNSEMVGMWYIFQSLGYIAQLMDLGFSFSFARNIAYCWCGARTLQKEGTGAGAGAEAGQNVDFYLMKVILQVCKKIYFLISATAGVLLLTAGSLYIWYLARSQTHQVVVCMIAWIIYVLAIWMNLYFGYFLSFLKGVGQVATANKLTVFTKSLQILVCVGLLASGAGLIGVSVAYCLYGVVFRMSAKRAFFRYGNIGTELGKVNRKPRHEEQKEVFVTIWHNAWRDGVVSISQYLSTQAGTLVTSAFLDLTQTGAYSLGMQLAGAITQLASAAYTAYQPTLQFAYIANDRKKMNWSMSTIVVSYVILFVLGFFALSMIGLPILRLIKPDSIVPIDILAGLCCCQFILKLRDCYCSYFSCTNRLFYMKAYIISSILGVVLSVILLVLSDGNIWGLIASQILCQLYNVFKWPRKAHKELALSVFAMPHLCMEEIKNKLGK